MTPLPRRVAEWLALHQPLPRNATVLVGVSGGPDSLCLLHLLAVLRESLRITVHVAHFNHHLRGAESDSDQAFVEGCARAWNLPLSVEHADVRGYAEQEHMNVHAAARLLRYRWFATLAATTGAAAVLVAHHANDQAETVLLHLVHGAGPAGLRGMLPVVPGPAWAANTPHVTTAPPLLRPLLGTTRAEIEQYCRTHGLAPVHDATNDDTAYTRNHLRHDTLPALASMNPQIVAALGRTAAIAADVHDFIQTALDAAWPALAHEAHGQITFAAAPWFALHPALQREAIRRAHALLTTGAALPWERLEHARALRTSGQRTELPGLVSAEITSTGALLFRRADAPHTHDTFAPQLAAEQPLHVPGIAHLVGGWAISADLVTAPPQPHRAAHHVYLDADALPGALLVRRRRPGDRIHADGHGSRRLQDMFVDAKIAQPLRANWPVLASADAVIWVPGIRAAAACVATPTTRNAIRIQLCSPNVAYTGEE